MSPSLSIPFLKLPEAIRQHAIIFANYPDLMEFVVISDYNRRFVADCERTLPRTEIDLRIRRTTTKITVRGPKREPMREPFELLICGERERCMDTWVWNPIEFKGTTWQIYRSENVWFLYRPDLKECTIQWLDLLLELFQGKIGELQFLEPSDYDTYFNLEVLHKAHTITFGKFDLDVSLLCTFFSNFKSVFFKSDVKPIGDGEDDDHENAPGFHAPLPFCHIDMTNWIFDGRDNIFETIGNCKSLTLRESNLQEEELNKFIKSWFRSDKMFDFLRVDADWGDELFNSMEYNLEELIRDLPMIPGCEKNITNDDLRYEEWDLASGLDLRRADGVLATLVVRKLVGERAQLLFMTWDEYNPNVSE